MLEVSDLACTRGDHRLFSGLSFSLSAGELMQVQGANGSGKTSLLRTLCGFMMPEAGEIRWRGPDIRELDEDYYAEMVYLGHLNAVKDELNALENLRINAGLAGCEVSDGQAIAALRRMGLRGRETLPVKVLSQGQRRRVALARRPTTSPTTSRGASNSAATGVRVLSFAMVGPPRVNLIGGPAPRCQCGQDRSPDIPRMTPKSGPDYSRKGRFGEARPLDPFFSNQSPSGISPTLSQREVFMPRDDRN